MIFIANPRRKKRIDEFVDKGHRVMSAYYEMLDAGASRQTMQRAMRRFIASDQDFYDPYLVLADVEIEAGNDEKAEAIVREAFARAVRRIADARGDWPMSMPWGWLENRHLMRTLERWAVVLWEKGKHDDALAVFRRLLRCNPGDNQGIRYSILAIRLGLGTDWHSLFTVKNGPMTGKAIDAVARETWFQKNAITFPEEFGWLKDAWRQLGHGC